MGHADARTTEHELVTSDDISATLTYVIMSVCKVYMFQSFYDETMLKCYGILYQVTFNLLLIPKYEQNVLLALFSLHERDYNLIDFTRRICDFLQAT
jgi:hypothetical protein